MIPTTSLKSETDIRLPLTFIIFALIASVVAQFIFFFNSDLLTSGHFRSTDIWMGAHFLLLGFAVMVAMGAMYQLVPVAFLTPIWNLKFGVVQCIITTIGITSLSVLLGIQPNLAIYGGILTVIGVILFIIQMFHTMRKQKKKNIMSYIVIAAITSFFFTVIAGFLLTWNFAFGGIGNHHSILYSHITLGVTGWFTLLIFGFSYKLVPMFSLSHGFSMKWAKPAFLTYVSGLVVLIASFWLNIITIFGWLLLFFGFLFFGLDMKEILDKRLKKKLDKPFLFSMIAIINGLIIHFLALLLSVLSIQNAEIWGWIIFLYIMGWIVFSILGYLYKIVPFLWWTHKYSERIGKEKVPTLKEMMNEKVAVYLFVFLFIGVIGLTISALLHLAVLVYIFQGVLAITSLIYAISVIRVLFQ